MVQIVMREFQTKLLVIPGCEEKYKSVCTKLIEVYSTTCMINNIVRRSYGRGGRGSRPAVGACGPLWAHTPRAETFRKQITNGKMFGKEITDDQIGYRINREPFCNYATHPSLE